MTTRGPEFLSQHVGKIRSSVGGFVPGSHATMRDVDLHSAFRNANWADLYLFATTGRRLSPAQLELLQSIWVYTSYPDARLWNNRVAALAGTARSSGALALAAALAVSEATIYGGGTYMPAIDFLQRAHRAMQAGGTLRACVDQELQDRRGIAGFGRPLTSKDERLVPLMERARSLGLDQGPHIRLVFEVARHLDERRLRLRPNYASVAAGLVVDMGFSARDFYFCEFPVFLAGMVPCFLEASEQPEGQLFPIPCEDIDYVGPAPRTWPKRPDPETAQSLGCNGSGA